MLNAETGFQAWLALTLTFPVIALLAERFLHRRAGYPLGVVLASATLAMGFLAPTVLNEGAVTWSAQWIPALDIDFSFRLDALALLFVLLVVGVGAVVFIWAPVYLQGHDYHAGHFYGGMGLFVAAMIGVVTANDVILLYVFWELTTLSSFGLILIAGKKGRRAAVQTLITTVIGGLCLLAGGLLLSVLAGSSRLSTIISSTDHLEGAGLAGLTLIVVAALTKSAQFPFHFWLPGAMVAPTPVSAYLHAAAMVKAGLYLLARVHPLLVRTEWLRWTIVILVLAGACYAAAMAMVRLDFKEILAYSTISQLGFIMALIGIGTFVAMVAAALHTVAHAAYKSALFMSAGSAEDGAGVSRIGDRGRLWRAMPVTTSAALLASASMVGLPPMIGFISKEEALDAVLHAHAPVFVHLTVAALALVAVALTVAYGARLFVDGFLLPGNGAGGRENSVLAGAPLLAAVAGLVLGVGPGLVGPLAEGAAEAATGIHGAIEIPALPGLTGALIASIGTLAAGVGMFAARGRLHDAATRLSVPDGARIFGRVEESLSRAGEAASHLFTARSSPGHLGWILIVAAVAGTATWFLRPGTMGPSLASNPVEEWFLVGLLAIACVGVARSHGRFASTALLGVVGFLVAAFYVLLGAPDLAMTQLLVETLTVALLVYVIQRLPDEYPSTSRAHAVSSVVVSVGMGVLATAAAFLMTGRRQISDIARFYLEQGPAEAKADNVVNAVLTDFRALDTLGEITVLAMGAIGVVVIVSVGGRAR